MKHTALFILFIAVISACRKTPSEKEIKHWRGTWEIVGVTGAGSVSVSEDDPFGKIVFFDDGTGELHLKNFNYTNDDEGIILTFCLNPDREKSHISLNQIARVEPGSNGYQFYTGPGAFPCSKGSFTLYTYGKLFGNSRKRTVELQSFPSCIFTPEAGSKITWELKRTSKKAKH